MVQDQINQLMWTQRTLADRVDRMVNRVWKVTPCDKSCWAENMQKGEMNKKQK